MTIRSSEVVKVSQQKVSPEPNEQTHPIIERLISLGFGVETARKYKARFGVKRIERNIGYAKAKQEAGLVKDFPAFLNQAIKEDMGGAWAVEHVQREQQREEKRLKAVKQAEQAELAHLQMLAERGGVSLDVLRPKLKS